MRTKEVASADEILATLCAAARSEDPFRLLIFDNCGFDIGAVGLGKQISADPSLHDTRLVLLSTTSWRGSETNLSEAGWSLYLEPPVPPRQLCAALVAVMRRPSQGIGSGALLTQHAFDESASPLEVPKAAGQTLDSPGLASHVLVAEDNRVNQKLVVRLLEKLGCTADIVSDGREALEQLTKSDYDLILMDCQMPEMDGYQATQAIRERERQPGGERIPIIALTANAMEGDRERCLEAGMDDYITKPISRKTLEAVLMKWLDPA